ncbi:unnamed protein product, partial [Closterium sp. NIES-54]
RPAVSLEGPVCSLLGTFSPLLLRTPCAAAAVATPAAAPPVAEAPATATRPTPVAPPSKPDPLHASPIPPLLSPSPSAPIPTLPTSSTSSPALRPYSTRNSCSFCQATTACSTHSPSQHNSHTSASPPASRTA